MRQTMDLLNLSQPWDCQRFPKSKTICYGGGGGGGGSIGNLGKVVEPSLKGLDLTKSTGALSPKGVKKITSSLKAAGDGSAFTDSVNKMNKETDKRLGLGKSRGSRISFPTSTGDIGIIKTVADKTGYTGSDLDKAGQATEKAITGGVKKAEETVKTITSIKPPPVQVKIPTEGFDEFGRRIKKGASSTIESVKKDVSSGIKKIEKAVSTSDLGKSDIGKATSAGIENVKKEGTKATNQIKQEANKLAKGDFSLKKAVQGTASGAAETFKKSDVGKVVKKIAKETGYTGSDLDKGFQKIEKEASNVVNQTLDFIDSPEKVIKKGVKRASDFVETVKGDLTDTANAYSKSLQSIGEAGENIGKAATDTFQIGMSAAGALGSNLANQLNTAFGDKGGLKGESENQSENQLGNRSNISDLLKQKRRARRGGLSRSGTSRTLITGKL